MVLRHVPSGTVVHCHAFRELAANRRRARTLLAARLADAADPSQGPAARARAEAQRRKAKRRQRARRKYGASEEGLVEAELEPQPQA